MIKRVFGKKFSRAQKARRALLRSLVRAFIIRGEITTTVPRAKYIKPVIDKLVTRAKKQTLEGRRSLFSFFTQENDAVLKLEEAAKKFKNRTSGFTTMVRVNRQRGDAAQMVKISWIKGLEKGKEGRGREQAIV